MKNIQAIPAPEEIETELFNHFENNQGQLDELVIGKMVARVKVEYALEHGAPDDVLVCAFDTVVLKTEGWGRERKRTYMQKPETREEAKAELVELFMLFAREKSKLDVDAEERLETGKHIPRFVRHLESFDSRMAIGRPQSLILVTTGIAVRLPGKGQEIETLPTAIRLLPHAVYAHAGLEEPELRQRLEELAEDALTIMDEGERWRNTTTGLDYSDPQIVGLLDIEEVLPERWVPPTEEGVLKGMPKEAFMNLLRGLARDEIEKTTDVGA